MLVLFGFLKQDDCQQSLNSGPLTRPRAWSAPDKRPCSDQVWFADKLSRGEEQLATLFATEKMKRDPLLYIEPPPLQGGRTRPFF